MRSTFKILSLVATVHAAAACGAGPRTHVREAIAMRAVLRASVAPAAPAPVEPNPPDAPAEIGLVETPILVVGEPLLQANGRPAPGNVQGKR